MLSHINSHIAIDCRPSLTPKAYFINPKFPFFRIENQPISPKKVIPRHTSNTHLHHPLHLRRVNTVYIGNIMKWWPQPSDYNFTRVKAPGS
ncbi:hypothetical protein [Chitinophaga sp. MD30]|uniref:hypothetical protein n=1 Tax=Chitinophaga sp. MD30 TaxID=2033437 RepID=UPI0012FD0821|nr:hypothetical protein [Chitinophaga sp. MD30]